MTQELIQTHREDRLLTVTLNRPEKANSLTPEMLITLRDIFRATHDDEGIHALIITGAGERVFCAGADLNTLYDPIDGPDPWQQMAQALHDVPVLTLAAINGPCMGGGLTLALGCDMRIGVPEARFSYPVLKNNVLPGQYDVDRLKALVGTGHTASILLGGSVVNADQAADWGLLDQVVAKDELHATAQALCATALLAERSHLAALKSMLWRT